MRDMNKEMSKTINKGRSTSNLSDYDNNRGLLSTLKREKFSASSNMLNHLTLQPSETNNDEAKAVAVQKKFANRAQSTNPATTKRMIWTIADDRQGTFS